jgi:hypothetical protein
MGGFVYIPFAVVFFLEILRAVESLKEEDGRVFQTRRSTKEYTMRNTILLIVVALVVGVAAGYILSNRESASKLTRDLTVMPPDKAESEVKETTQLARNYAYPQKAEFVDKTKKELVEIMEELDQLSARVERSNATVKDDAKTRLDAVREKWAQAEKQLDLAESATESSWYNVNRGFRKSYGELKDSVEETRQWLSDKIEP